MPGMSGAQVYFSLCGVELWNQARLKAYMDHGVTPAGARLRVDGCEALPDVIPCEEHRPPTPAGYELPEIDDAPWYDPTVPESRNFAGLLVTDMSISSPVNRRLVQNVGHGAVLGRMRHPGRTIDVEGWLVGKTCCAANYGLKWLTQALLGDLCDCDGCDAHFLSCCPEVSGEDACLVLDGVTYVRPASTPEYQRASDFVRNMYRVGLLDGPEVVQCRGIGCGCGCATLTKVEFTLGVGTPWQYLEPTVVAENLVLGSCDPDVCTVEWVKDPSCADRCEPADCTADPLAPSTPAPPRARTPLAAGVCIPLSQQRTCIEVNATNEREWFESTLNIEVSAGSEPLRNLMVRLFENPAGLTCCDGSAFGDCLPCSSLYVRYVPAGGTIRIDGEKREARMRCFGVAEVDASTLVYTVEGGGLRWIDLACTPYCLAVDTDCFNTAADASISVWQVQREL